MQTAICENFLNNNMQSLDASDDDRNTEKFIKKLKKVQFYFDFLENLYLKWFQFILQRKLVKPMKYGT